MDTQKISLTSNDKPLFKEICDDVSLDLYKMAFDLEQCRTIGQLATSTSKAIERLREHAKTLETLPPF